MKTNTLIESNTRSMLRISSHFDMQLCKQKSNFGIYMKVKEKFILINPVVKVENNLLCCE